MIFLWDSILALFFEIIFFLYGRFFYDGSRTWNVREEKKKTNNLGRNWYRLLGRHSLWRSSYSYITLLKKVISLQVFQTFISFEKDFRHFKMNLWQTRFKFFMEIPDTIQFRLCFNGILAQFSKSYSSRCQKVLWNWNVLQFWLSDSNLQIR